MLGDSEWWREGRWSGDLQASNKNMEVSSLGFPRLRAEGTRNTKMPTDRKKKIVPIKACSLYPEYQGMSSLQRQKTFRL